MISWLNKEEFEIEGIHFTIDITPGPHRRISTKKNFTLVKTKSYIENYLALQSKPFNHILELGIFQGGSLVFFDKIFKPKKIVGLDISPNKIKALEEYISTEAQHIKTYYESSQDDADLLNTIVTKDLDGKLDLVVDDASHLYELTKKSFSVLFPLLKAGGVYIIEDWAWSLRPNAQNKNHPWYKKAALANLLFEIAIELGSSNEIKDIYINNNIIKVEKSINSNSSLMFQDIPLRGRKMTII